MNLPYVEIDRNKYYISKSEIIVIDREELEVLACMVLNPLTGTPLKADPLACIRNEQGKAWRQAVAEYSHKGNVKVETIFYSSHPYTSGQHRQDIAHKLRMKYAETLPMIPNIKVSKILVSNEQGLPTFFSFIKLILNTWHYPKSTNKSRDNKCNLLGVIDVKTLEVTVWISINPFI